MKFSILPALVGLLVIAAMGAVHGALTDRWVTSNQLEYSLTALDKIPMRIGEWEGEDSPLEEDLSRMGILGSVQRRYRSVVTREVIMCLIVCGRGGPISVHTPDVCYTGAGYREITAETYRKIETDENHTFVCSRFAKPNSILPTQLEIFWGWSRDGDVWQAPSNPRLTLARSPALYKLYAIREVTPGTRSDQSNATEAFLKSALPVLKRSLARDRS